ARPGVARALQHQVRPDRVATVFAGADIEATEKARGYFTGYRPSSPSIARVKDGKLVYMMERYQIEGKGPDQIAQELTQAFDEHCATTTAAAN
ncbi:MAG TPA: BrxA/BrxB family bacilliredoxin, partial [Pyrinomonadaceae bacterium]|nr:BrxA/BrxB family bacilliredoxin [Pyrinomonadaceae bacterium]